MDYPTKRTPYKPRTPRTLLEKRALALTRRGFDVPPSKMAAYKKLIHMQRHTVLEAKELLGLE